MKQITAVSLALLGTILLTWVLQARHTVSASPIQAAAPRVALAASDADVACSGANLLANPSFEGAYTAYIMPPPGHHDCSTWSPDQPNQYCERAQMPAAWHPYWVDTPRTEPWMNIMPEYKPSLPYEQPPRVRSGDKSLHYFSFWSTHEGGMYQQVTAVPGAEYCFSLWGHAWSSATTLDGYVSDPNNHGELYQRVGIDPTGGTDWQSPTVIWSDARLQYDEFGLFRVEATAQADKITVFAWSRPNWPTKHNDAYWDDATLTVTQFAQVSEDPITALVDVDEPVTLKRTVSIDVSPGLSWTAEWDSGGSLTPLLSQNSGAASAALEMTVDTTGLTAATYQTSLTITTNPAVAGSPFTIPVTVYVVPQVTSVYAPLALR